MAGTRGRVLTEQDPNPLAVLSQQPRRASRTGTGLPFASSSKRLPPADGTCSVDLARASPITPSVRAAVDPRTARVQLCLQEASTLDPQRCKSPCVRPCCERTRDWRVPHWTRSSSLLPARRAAREAAASWGTCNQYRLQLGSQRWCAGVPACKLERGGAALARLGRARLAVRRGLDSLLKRLPRILVPVSGGSAEKIGSDGKARRPTIQQRDLVSESERFLTSDHRLLRLSSSRESRRTPSTGSPDLWLEPPLSNAAGRSPSPRQPRGSTRPTRQRDQSELCGSQ